MIEGRGWVQTHAAQFVNAEKFATPAFRLLAAHFWTIAGMGRTLLRTQKVNTRWSQVGSWAMYPDSVGTSAAEGKVCEHIGHRGQGDGGDYRG